MAKTPQSRSTNLLFIGNSFTQRNSLPELLAELAAARNLSVRHELISVGGASLRTHWNAGQAAKAIATGGYHYVVLQEQSTLPVKNAHRMAENVRLFDEAIKQAGSEKVLYMTWAREVGQFQRRRQRRQGVGHLVVQAANLVALGVLKLPEFAAKLRLACVGPFACHRLGSRGVVGYRHSSS